jgi:hypothetical protein
MIILIFDKNTVIFIKIENLVYGGSFPPGGAYACGIICNSIRVLDSSPDQRQAPLNLAASNSLQLPNAHTF